MNVLVVTYTVDKNDISEGQMAYEWISRLSEHVQLWVVTTGSRLHATCGLEDNPNVHLITIPAKVSFKRFDGFDRAAQPGYIEFYFRAKRAIRQIINEQHIDLCHHLTPQSPRFPSPLANCGVPYVVGPIHGGMQPPAVMKELSGKEDAFFLLRKLDVIRNRWDVVLRRTFMNAASTIVSAPYVSESPPASFCSSIRVIPGVAIEMPRLFQQHQERSGPVRFIYAGRLVPSKGVELMIEALSRCTEQNSVLLIYGCGQLEPIYKKLATDLGIGDRVYWNGFIAQNDLLKEFAKADVFLFPSLKEPMGTVVLEAMGTGLPVVCVDVGGPSCMVTDQTGIKIHLGTKEEMVENLVIAIEKLAGSREMREEMGRNARQRVDQEFTWESIVNKMLGIYEDFFDNTSGCH